MRSCCIRKLPPRPSTRDRLWRLVNIHTESSVSIQSRRFSSLLSHSPNKVKIVEVGPRDGLQNEAVPVSTENKIALITKLAEAGCSFIEAGSFVSPKWVPSMADSKEVMDGLNAWRQDKHSSPVFSCLVPNLAGLQQAIEVNVDEIAIFGSASEVFSQKVSQSAYGHFGCVQHTQSIRPKYLRSNRSSPLVLWLLLFVIQTDTLRQNINCSIEESIQRFREVADQAKEHNIPIRGYLSCVVGCPYQGPVAPSVVARAAEKLMELGCHELSLGDTIGVGTPASTIAMLQAVDYVVTTDKLAVHFHDTYGQALVNILVSLEHGIKTIDSSVAGLGGCPYAKGASGNVATEDLVYMLDGLGVETGIDLDKLVDAGEFICSVLGRESRSKAGLALTAKRRDGYS
jgi:hydroxymethylglutaryl-CoA lyase